MDKEYYLRLRNRYKPAQINIVFILESPPASGKYFYDETGLVSEPLFSAMMQLLKYEQKSKKEGLQHFAGTGHFIVDATYWPVNELRGQVREAAIFKDFSALVEDLRSLGNLDGVSIVLVKANICRILEHPLIAEGFNIVNNGIIIPFPSTGQQVKFRTKISDVYRHIPSSA